MGGGGSFLLPPGRGATETSNAEFKVNTSAVCLGPSLGPESGRDSGHSPQSCWGRGWRRGSRGLEGLGAFLLPTWCLLRRLQRFGFHPLSSCLSEQRLGISRGGVEGVGGSDHCLPGLAWKGLGKATEGRLPVLARRAHTSAVWLCHCSPGVTVRQQWGSSGRLRGRCAQPLFARRASFPGSARERCGGDTSNDLQMDPRVELMLKEGHCPGSMVRSPAGPAGRRGMCRPHTLWPALG